MTTHLRHTEPTVNREMLSGQNVQLYGHIVVKAGVLILKQSRGPGSRSRSTLTLHSRDQPGWFGGVLAEPRRHLVDQHRNNSWDHELQIRTSLKDFLCCDQGW